MSLPVVSGADEGVAAEGESGSQLAGHADWLTDLGSGTISCDDRGLTSVPGRLESEESS